MGRSAKHPNRLLVELIEETGLSRKGLARRVIDRGRAVGLDLSYDHNSVRRWLDGDQPYDPTPELIAAVLTEALGRPVTPADCGLSAGQGLAELGLAYDLTWSETVNTVTTLWRSDVGRSRYLRGLAYAVAVYPAATMRWLTLPDPDCPSSQGRRRVGRTEIDAVQSVTAAFQDLDNKLGGGRVRSAVVHFLNGDAASLLTGRYSEDTGRRLFAAVAELTKLAGWMAYDAEEHGLAQRYLIQALRLAKTAGDLALSAEILAAMSHQATYVGRPGDAVDLARVAQLAARRAGIGTLESECHVVEAHGHAGRHDASACATALTAAEKAFDAGDESPHWLRYYDEAYLAAKIAHCFRDLCDDRRSRQYAEQSLHMSDGYLRGRAFNLCVLASAHSRDDPHEAVRLGYQAVELVEQLSSKRTHSYLRDLARRLHRHVAIPEVAEFRQRVSLLTRRA
jgi:hypothetical protein